MQIHELDTFQGTPGSSDFLAIDDGTNTARVASDQVGITAQMTVAEAEAGSVTAPRVVSPQVLHDYVDGNYVGKDSNGNATVEGTLTVEGHSTPIGTQLSSGTSSSISLASGGSLKSTGITVTLPIGVWIISYYGSFGANAANPLYRGIALRYRETGASSWSTWVQSQMTVGSWSSATEVAPAIVGCAVTRVDSEREFELLARTNPAVTDFSGRIVAFRIA